MRFEPQRITEALSRLEWVGTVHAIAETVSTNDDALALADGGAREGTVVFADVQRFGRGRLGRAWVSQKGTTLTASWILRPTLPTERWAVIPLAAGIAVSDALRDLCGVDAMVKWPNDVFVSGRKIAGILVEARPPDAAVVGVGVNLSNSLPDELSATAITVATAGGSVPPREDLLAAILQRFVTEMRDPAGLIGRYRERCATLGRNVRIERMGLDPLEGLVEDLDADGALLIRSADELHRVTSGEVVHLRG